MFNKDHSSVSKPKLPVLSSLFPCNDVANCKSSTCGHRRALFLHSSSREFRFSLFCQVGISAALLQFLPTAIIQLLAADLYFLPCPLFVYMLLLVKVVYIVPYFLGLISHLDMGPDQLHNTSCYLVMG